MGSVKKHIYGISVGVCSLYSVYDLDAHIFAFGMDGKACVIFAENNCGASVTCYKTDDIVLFFCFYAYLAVFNVKLCDFGSCGAIEIALVKGVDNVFVGELFGTEHCESAAHIMWTVVVICGNAFYHFAFAEKIVINMTAIFVPSSDKTPVVVDLKIVKFGVADIFGIVFNRPAGVVVGYDEIFVTQYFEAGVDVFGSIVSSVESGTVGAHEGALVLVHRPAHLRYAVVYVKSGLRKVFSVSGISAKMGGFEVGIVISVGAVEIHFKTGEGEKILIVKLKMGKKTVVVGERNDRITMLLVCFFHFFGRNTTV